MGEMKRKNAQFRKAKPPCVYCGNPGETLDHVPPKGIFIKPRPELITVPACFNCNNGASDFDEKFKVFLSLTVGSDSKEALDLFHEGAMRTLRKNNKLYREIVDSPDAFVFTKNGLERTKIISWNSNSHSSTIDRMTRGLYWKKFGESIPKDMTIDTMFLKDGNIDGDILRDFTWSNIGGKKRFLYGYIRPFNNNPTSVWYYQFYEGHWASAVVNPEGIKEDWSNHEISDDAIRILEK